MSNKASPINDEHFRDTISLVDRKSGDRAWVYSKKPKGPLYTGRTWFSIALMILMFAGPYLKINDHPVLLLNIIERKFIIFGIPFWPQDLPLFALLMLTFVMFIIVFTVLFGRLWCGWACPQTIFMEMLFRKIEYFIEGDHKQQRILDDAPWNANKIIRKSIKHIVFFGLSFWIANTFLAYLIGIDEVRKMAIDGPMEHFGQFSALIIFSTAFYFVFAKFRELVCIVICPYGRLQGLMLDKNSIVVAYDFVRGEPRGLRRKAEDQSHLGDCVDCKRCVHVCPTGIDIRNGTQLECVNCTACIDECNDVMQHIQKPKGLIRYASQEQITLGHGKRITVRSMAYVVILGILVTLLMYFTLTRKDVDASILRTPGMTYQQQDEKHVSNMYNFEVINKTFKSQQIRLVLISPKNATLKMIDREENNIELKEDDIIKGSFFIIRDRSEIDQNNTPAIIEIHSNGEVMKTIRTNFLGPVTLN